MQDLVSWQHVGHDGLTLRGWRTMPSGRPAIFFIHGNGLCSMTYWPMLERLRDQFDLILLDAPGHGLSDTAGHFQGWEADAACCHAAWLSLVGEYVGVKHHVVAHSYGGVLSTCMIAVNPETFDSAVLLDPVYFPPSMLVLARIMSVFGLVKKTKLAKTTAKRRDRWPSREAVHEHLLDKRIYAKWEPACFDAYVQYGLRDCDDGVGVRLRCDRALEAEIFSTLPYRLPRIISRVKTPCIVFSGDQSYDFVVKGLPKYCSGHNYLQHREISGSHNFMLEQTEKTAELLRGALEEAG